MLFPRTSLFMCVAALVSPAALSSSAAQAQMSCPVSHDQLADALKKSVKASGGPGNGGYDNHEWAAVVTRDGTVCSVAFSGSKPDDQWPGSRAIAMEKASTANAFSVKQMAIATANVFAPAQPGQPLFSITGASPPSAEATLGDATRFGMADDPMVGKRIGGIIVFGGGLALYNGSDIVGGLGISGDSSCADHNVAWRVRQALGLEKVPAGLSPERKDAIIFDVGADGKSASGWGHPKCAGSEADVAQELGAGVGGYSLNVQMQKK
jgi:uncharacterized protein GlcG (DUF336 family)